MARPTNRIQDDRAAARRGGLRRFSPAGVHPADLFDAWMFAEADVALALAAWRCAPSGDKRIAHAAYVAALDREAEAAEGFRRSVDDAR
jgi:hypothetical protein